MPSFIGRRVIDAVPLERLLPFIDWTFFFAAWQVKGRFPAVLDHPEHGQAARELYDDGRRLLDDIVAGRLLTARGVYGFWPAAADSDDIVVFDAEDRQRERGPIPDAPPAGRAERRRLEPQPGRLRRTRREPACATTLAPSP